MSTHSDSGLEQVLRSAVEVEQREAGKVIEGEAGMSEDDDE